MNLAIFYYYSGSTNGQVSIWDQNVEHLGLECDADGIAEIPTTLSFSAHDDCTNGIRYVVFVKNYTESL